MVKFYKEIATAIVVITSVVCSCKLVGDDKSGGQTIKDLKLENGQIGGWNETAEKGFVQFNPSNMFGLVNGGALEYINKGMVEGFEQNMQKDGKDYKYKSWVMDFSTAENAITMYNVKVQQFSSTKETVGAFADTDAFVKPTSYGYDAYAHFGKFMIVLNFTEYGTNKTEAKSNAEGFLNSIQNKIDAFSN